MLFKLGEKKDCGLIVKSINGSKFKFISATYEHIGYKLNDVIASGSCSFNNLTGQVWIFLAPEVYSKVIFTMEIQCLLESGLDDTTQSIETILGEILVKI